MLNWTCMAQPKRTNEQQQQQQRQQSSERKPFFYLRSGKRVWTGESKCITGVTNDDYIVQICAVHFHANPEMSECIAVKSLLERRKCRARILQPTRRSVVAWRFDGKTKNFVEKNCSKSTSKWPESTWKVYIQDSRHSLSLECLAFYSIPFAATLLRAFLVVIVISALSVNFFVDNSLSRHPRPVHVIVFPSFVCLKVPLFPNPLCMIVWYLRVSFVWHYKFCSQCHSE